MMIKNRLIPYLALIATFANAEVIGGADMLKQNPDAPLQSIDPNTGKTISNMQPNLIYPIDNKLKNKTPAVKQKEFQLSINPNAVQEVREKKENYENLITNTNIDYLIDPQRRVLRDMDIVELHSNYISTITFPSQVKILGARSSVPMQLLQANQNVLLIQPEATFRNGNIFITYRSATRNYTMNLLVKNYQQNKRTPLKISYQYVWDKDGKVDYVDILQKYITLNGASKLERNFAKLGDYDTITLNSKTYYIIRDNGTSGNNYVDYKDMRFKISTRYEFENKSAKDREKRKYKVKNIKKVANGN